MSCTGFRNPALLAKMGATLQYLSGGRFILGIGAGWHPEEWQAYGYDFIAVFDCLHGRELTPNRF